MNNPLRLLHCKERKGQKIVFVKIYSSLCIHDICGNGMHAGGKKSLCGYVQMAGETFGVISNH